MTYRDQLQSLFGRLLGLDITHDAVGPIPQAEIRVASIRRLGKGCYADVRASARLRHLREHVGQRRVEALFPRVSLERHRGQFLQVL